MVGREYRGKRVVVWPVYLDRRASRGIGRRIPKARALDAPKVEEIVEAARALGLNPEVEEKAHPRDPRAHPARVVVDKRGSKRATLQLIADKIRELRSRRPGEPR